MKYCYERIPGFPTCGAGHEGAVYQCEKCARAQEEEELTQRAALGKSCRLIDRLDELEAAVEKQRGSSWYEKNQPWQIQQLNAYRKVIWGLQDRVAELEKALETEMKVITDYDRGATHWENCENDHPRCAAYKRMRKAFDGQARE